MKTQSTKITNPNYSSDYKEVLKHYLLKNEVIEKYNSDKSSMLKGKKHE